MNGPTRGTWALVTTALATLVAAATLVRSDVALAQSRSSTLECVHPYPCEGDWPDGLEGPFELKEVVHVRVPSFDGVLLDGWIGIPDLPAGVGAPTLLSSSVNLGACFVTSVAGPGCRPTPAHWFGDDPPPTALLNGIQVPPIDLVREGYAYAFFSVRGTGNSGGCASDTSPEEHRDQAVLIEWLADQPWSNGRVAMLGLSYTASTAIGGAIRDPALARELGEIPALKTVIVGGIVSDLYTYFHTPQGARFTNSYAAAVFSNALAFGDEPSHTVLDHGTVPTERVCGSTVTDPVGLASGHVTDMRDERFWNDRRLIDRFDDITASVFVVHGLQDSGSHAFQENEVWDALTSAPKRMIQGQWAHTFPVDEGSLDPSWPESRWPEMVMAWLDYWLKGMGSPSRIGVVDYQEVDGAWHASKAWPPVEADERLLYLAGEDVATEPADSSRSFRSAPNILNSYIGATLAGFPYSPWAALCHEPATSAAGTAGLVFETEPLERPVVVAGNPFAYLNLSSDLPGGLVTLALADLAPDFHCDALGQPSGLRHLTYGGADLRFHRGNIVGTDFPVATPTRVRVDLVDLAARVPAGHRLAVVASYGETHAEFSGGPYYPRITLHGDSELILPLVKGTLGARKTRGPYPPRPFLPSS